jgi:autotransporter-associated beta strand protein
MKKNEKIFIFALLMIGMFFVPIQVSAETVEISTAQTTMQDLDSISGGATPKTALVTPTGSVVVSSETDSAIWGKSAGWSVTVSLGRTVQSGKMGVNFNTVKDASGNDVTGTLVNGGYISASGITNYVFGVNAGENSSITNQSGASISGSTTGRYGLGIYADSNSTITNWGDISGTAGTLGYSYGIWANKGNSSITNKSGGTISAGSSGSGNYGVRASYAGSTVINEAGATITANGASNSAGISMDDNSTVTNAGTITGVGTTGSGYGISTGKNSTIVNTGSVTGNGFLSGYGISTGSGSTITNETGATITASGGNAAAGINMNTASTAVNNGTITVNSGNAGGTVNSGITGTNATVTNNGSIAVNGNLALGLNLISSGTAVNNGTISVTGSTGVKGAYIDGSGTLSNSSTGTITSSGTGVTFRSVGSGVGLLDNFGTISGETGISATAGNLIIRNYGTGAITGTGGTAISLDGDNNTVFIQEGSSINGAIEASGSGNSLEFNGMASYASNITGTWALMKSGSGTLILSGDNTYTGGTTVSEGILQGDTNSLQGDIVNYGQVTFNQNFNGTYASVISEFVTGTKGSLLKEGTGTLTLTGANTYTGDTRVNAGALAVSGSIVGPVTVGAAGTLSGTGSVGSVTNSGILAPGMSPGTLNIGGNLTLDSGSTTQIEIGGISSGEYDVLNVTGTANLAGLLDVSLWDWTDDGLDNPFAPKVGDVFDIIKADAISTYFNSVIFAPLENSLNWKLDYLVDAIGSTDVVRLSIEASSPGPVPEPSTILLFGMGLMLWARSMRRHFFV